MRYHAALAMGLAMLGGCAPGNHAVGPVTVPMTHEPPAGVAAAGCSPRAWETLVGQPATEARLPAGLAYRVMQRGALIGNDYRDERLNIVTDAAGNVVAVGCG